MYIFVRNFYHSKQKKTPTLNYLKNKQNCKSKNNNKEKKYSRKYDDKYKNIPLHKLVFYHIKITN